MTKFLTATAGVVVATMLAVPAFANETGITKSASLKASASLTAAQLSCIAPAVEVRENAVVTAHTTYNTSVLNALTARRTSLVAAFKISNNQERQVAITAAWKVYTSAIQKARTQLKTDINAAWKVFASATVTCNIGAHGTGSTLNRKDDDRGRRNDRDEKKNGNNGWHLGDLKKMLKHDLDADVKVNGSAKIDLSL